MDPPNQITKGALVESCMVPFFYPFPIPNTLAISMFNAYPSPHEEEGWLCDIYTF